MDMRDLKPSPIPSPSPSLTPSPSPSISPPPPYHHRFPHHHPHPYPHRFPPPPPHPRHFPQSPSVLTCGVPSVQNNATTIWVRFDEFDNFSKLVNTLAFIRRIHIFVFGTKMLQKHTHQHMMMVGMVMVMVTINPNTSQPLQQHLSLHSPSIGSHKQDRGHRPLDRRNHFYQGNRDCHCHPKSAE